MSIGFLSFWILLLAVDSLLVFRALLFDIEAICLLIMTQGFLRLTLKMKLLTDLLLEKFTLLI